ARARTFRYLRDAQTYDAEVRRRLRLGEVGIIEGQRLTLTELRDSWTSAHYPNLSRMTIQSYDGIWSKHIEERFGRAKLGELRVPVIQAYVDELVRKDVGVATINRILVVLGAILRFGCEQELMTRNPVQFVRKPKGKRPAPIRTTLGPTEVEAIR